MRTLQVGGLLTLAKLTVRTEFRCRSCNPFLEDTFDPTLGVFTMKVSPNLDRKAKCPKCGSMDVELV